MWINLQETAKRIQLKMLSHWIEAVLNQFSPRFNKNLGFHITFSKHRALIYEDVQKEDQNLTFRQKMLLETVQEVQYLRPY